MISLKDKLEYAEAIYRGCLDTWEDLPPYVYTTAYYNAFMHFIESRVINESIDIENLVLMTLHHETGGRLPYFKFNEETPVVSKIIPDITIEVGKESTNKETGSSDISKLILDASQFISEDIRKSVGKHVVLDLGHSSITGVILKLKFRSLNMVDENHVSIKFNMVILDDVSKTSINIKSEDIKGIEYI